MDYPCFGVLGGDLRQQMLYNSLKEDGYSAKIFGTDDSSFDLDSFLKDIDILILPLPVSADDQTVFAPFYTGFIYLSEIFEKFSGRAIFGGKINSNILKLSKISKAKIFDYYGNEEMTLKNVVPTVEGALMIAINNTDFTLHNSNCFVLGHGRISKYLTNVLKALGADVTVFARKSKDIAMCQILGYKTAFGKNELYQKIGNADIIFNTVPSVILNSEILKKVKKDCLIIDLASGVGGVDFKSAKSLGIHAIHALSLPGKVAPKTAGKIIKDTVISISKEVL